MPEQQPASDEVVLKEYPHSTRWMDGEEIIGIGNLILTTERLIFLHRMSGISPEQTETIAKLSEEKSTRKLLDFSLTLYRKNFQIPLNSIISVKTGLFTLLPFPRPCLRLSHQKKRKVEDLSFIFTIPLWKGWFQLEITTVMLWVNIIKKAMYK